MTRIGRVPVHLVLALSALVGIAACDPKDLFGPAEGPPRPPEDFFGPSFPPPFEDFFFQEPGIVPMSDAVDPAAVLGPVEAPDAQ
jgi:hypothetical protein